MALVVVCYCVQCIVRITNQFDIALPVSVACVSVRKGYVQIKPWPRTACYANLLYLAPSFIEGRN